MSVTGIAELIGERRRFMDTIESLPDDDFERGRTLCAEWTPRDVLVHVLGIDDLVPYVRNFVRVNATNATLVAAGRELPRAELTERGHRWADQPSLTSRIAAHGLIGDVAVHHQDILRGLGRTREIPTVAAGAIFREGVILSTGTRRSLLRYRVVPTTAGGRAIGRGTRVHGTTEALGLWLAGRKGIDTELRFAS